MAQYFWSPRDLPTGDSILSHGWTARLRSPDWRIREVTDVPGNRVMRLEGHEAEGEAHVVSLDGVPAVQDAEILLYLRPLSIGGTAVPQVIGSVYRWQEDTRSGYASAHGHDPGFGMQFYALSRVSQEVDTLLDVQVADPQWTVNVWRFVRARMSGPAIMWKTWAGTLEDEPAGWDIDALDSEISIPGIVALVSRGRTDASEWELAWVGFGTDGDPAPSEPFGIGEHEDDFEDGIDTTQWTFWGDPSNVSVENGRLVIGTTPLTAGYSGIASLGPRKLVDGMTFGVEVLQVATGSDVTETVLAIGRRLLGSGYDDEDAYLTITAIDNSIQMWRKWVGQQPVQLGSSLAYDPVLHRYWRYRMVDGTVYGEVSPDGETWTTPPGWSVVPDFPDFDALLGMVLSGDFAGLNPSPTPAIIGGVNVVSETKPAFILVPSEHVDSGAVTGTTPQLTPPAGKTAADFTAGKISDDTPDLTVQIGEDGYTELEWSIEATEDAAFAATYEFRVVVDGQPLEGYDHTPEWTVAEDEEPVEGTVGITGGGEVQAAGSSTQSGSVALTGAGDVVVAGASGRSGAVTISGGGGVLTSSTAVRMGSATVSGGGVITAAGVAVRAHTASVSGGGTIEASGIATRHSTADVSGAGALDAAGTSLRTGVTSLTGRGAVAVGGASVRAGAASLSDSGSLVVTGTSARAGSVDVSGGGGITATGTSGVGASVRISGGGRITATGTSFHNGKARVTGGGTVETTAGSSTRAGTLMIRGGGQVSTTGARGAAGVVSVTGGGHVTAAGASQRAGATGVSGGGRITVVGRSGQGGVVSVSGGGAVTVSGRSARASAPTIAGGGRIAVTGIAVRHGPPTVSGGGDVVATGTPARAGAVEVFGAGAIDIRHRTARAGAVAVSGGGSVSIVARSAVIEIPKHNIHRARALTRERAVRALTKEV